MDLVIIGDDSGTKIAKVYINNASTQNIPPHPPNSLNASYQNGQLTLTWNNASDNETPVLGLYYNLKVGNSSNKHSIVSGVYGGGDDNGYFGNMMQRKSLTLKNLNLQPNQTIYWSVQTIDTTLKAGNWSVEQNYTLPLDITQPTITLNAPVDQFNTTNPIITFNATVYDNINLTNVSLYGNWSGWHLNETNSSGANNTDYIFTKNLTVLGDGTYQWRIEARDATNNSINSSTRTFRIDTTYPVINLATPANASTWTSSQTVTFTYNVTDLALSNCSLILGGSIDQTDETVTVNSAQTFTKSLSNGDYNWSINCTDSVNYQNNSETRYLTVSYTPPSSSSSGGGGGSSSGSGSAVAGTTTYVVSDAQLASGYTNALGKGDKMKFIISNAEHYLTMESMTSVSATFNVTSKVYRILLDLGQSIKLELDGDNYKDLVVTLNAINASKVKANLTIQKIHEAIKEINVSTIETEANKSSASLNATTLEKEIAPANLTKGETKSYAKMTIKAILRVVGVALMIIITVFMIQRIVKLGNKKKPKHRKNRYPFP